MTGIYLGVTALVVIALVLYAAPAVTCPHCRGKKVYSICSAHRRVERMCRICKNSLPCPTCDGVGTITSWEWPTARWRMKREQARMEREIEDGKHV